MDRHVRWTLTGAGLAAAALTAVLLAASAGHGVTRVAEAAPATTTPPAPPPSSSSSSSSPSDTPTPTPTTSTTTPSPLPDPATLADEITDAVTGASHGTKVGIDIYDMRTGKTLTAAESGQPFYTASVVKLLIALDVVHDDDSGTWQLPDSGTVGDLEDMLSGSNDALASQFWEEDGGTGIISRMADLLGLDDTLIPTDPGQWGMTKMSPADVVTVYRYLEDTVPDTVSQPLVDALAHAREPADDGYDQYFGIPDGLPGASWAIKQGWMILRTSLVLNTTGVVGGRYVVVLCTQQPAGTSAAKGGAAVTAGIAAAAGVLSG